MNSHDKSLDFMIKSIINERPNLKHLVSDTAIFEYLKPALVWKKDKDFFPYAEILSKIICLHIERIYGKNISQIALQQLSRSWVVETGAHLHLPRRYNNARRSEGPQINSLLFQGQVLWALVNQQMGFTLSISLNSGRVPLDNTNSGAYLDLPSLHSPIPMASKERHPDSPQSLIPARSIKDISQKIELIKMYRKQKMITEDELELGFRVLSNFLSIQTSFSDQVASSHALMLNSILPIKQITIDSEFIGKDFLISLLKDKSSLTYSIFIDSKKRMKFIEYLSDIHTGWSKDSSPFYFVSRDDNTYRLIKYRGDLTPKAIIKGLEENYLWPTGVMKFFAFMIEGGLLSIGGWSQTTYCTDIKEKSIALLEYLGEFDRLELLKKMPTHLAAVGPCWGIYKNNEKHKLLDPITTFLYPKKIDFSHLTNLTAFQTLLIAAPTLYEFLLHQPSVINYNQLENFCKYIMVNTAGNPNRLDNLLQENPTSF